MKHKYKRVKVGNKVDVFIKATGKEILGNPYRITKVSVVYVKAVDRNKDERTFRFGHFDFVKRQKNETDISKNR